MLKTQSIHVPARHQYVNQGQALLGSYKKKCFLKKNKKIKILEKLEKREKRKVIRKTIKLN